MQSNYIPNIDLADIINKDLNSDAAIQVSNNIKKASEEIGFFTVTNHGIPISKIDNLLKTCKKFFYLNEEEKLKIAPKKWNPNTNTVYRGYFPSSVNGKEGLDIGDPLLKQNMVDLLKKEKYVVFLNASVESQFQATKDKTKRPLLNNDNPRQVLESLYERRLELYKSVSNLELSPDLLSNEDIVKKIINFLNV